MSDKEAQLSWTQTTPKKNIET